MWDGRYRMSQNVRAAKGLTEPNHSSHLEVAGGPRRLCPRSHQNDALHMCVVVTFVFKTSAFSFYSYF